MSYFKKFGNIASCKVYSRKNAKVQQARIVYDSALSIARFDTQWAIYCFSTCLRVTPCHYTVDQKSSRHEFVATLTQLPPNTKDIDLAPLTRDLGAKAVNVPLSLHSYKPKRWAYVTFNSQETMDATMKQIIGFRGHTLQWNLPDNTNKLCHRPKERSRSGSHSRLRSKGPGNSQPFPPQKPLANSRLTNNPRWAHSKFNDKRDRSVSFSTVLRTPPHPSTPNQSVTMSPRDAADILSLLKSLQQDMAEVRDHITALELNDRYAQAIPDSTVAQVFSQPTTLSIQTPLNPLSPGCIPTRPVRAPLSAPVTVPNTSLTSSTSHSFPSPTQAHDEIQAINAKHSAIENKLDMLANSISGFIRSITSSSSLNSANTADIENLSLQDSLFSSNSLSSPSFNSFTISSFNINGLKMHPYNKIELLNNFFSLKQISFGGVIDTHLHPKQMHFFAKRLSNYTVFSTILDTSQYIRSSGGVSLFIENSLTSHVHTYVFHSSRLLSVDLYFKGNVKLHQFYPIFFNQPQIASKRIHRLFNFFLSNGYADYTPVNFSDSLGTFHRADIVSRIDYVWSCPFLRHFLLTSVILDARDINFSDHNPVITYYDYSFLSSSVKPALAHQLQRHSRRIFSFDTVTPSQWDDFSAHVDTLCNITPTTFASWHVNRICEYLHTIIIAGANTVLPARTVGNDHTPKLPKDLETLIQHYRFLNRVLHSIKLLRKYPHTFSSSHDRKWGLHLLKEKEFQYSSIKAHLESQNQKFDTDISSFINSALSRSRRQIVLDRVFIDHSTSPQLLTDPADVSAAVTDHFQHAVPIKSNPPSHISALPDRWRSEYSPMDDVSPDIYSSLLSPPSLEEWLSTVSSIPNGKAPDPSMITYEMLKHLGPTTNSLLLTLIRKCFASADIPDLWRQAIVFPIPKPHEWRCQLKNTRPITLLEVIRKSLVKLFYNRLSAILTAHNVLKGGNFAGLPGRTCRDPIITLESIIHDANHYNSRLWILSQDISKAFDSVNLTMLRFALERIRLPASAITFILSLFMNRSNQIFTAYGETSFYRVRIGIDQGEVISPLLWVIYIDPLLNVLNTEVLDPYVLRSPTLLSNATSLAPDIIINNLVFMDDSTLISSSKAGLEHMLSITEEFYALNNTSANHQKYVLITNSLPLTTTSTILPVKFHLSLSSLNNTSSISVTPLSITSSFRFLGVWFNIKGSRDFIKKQIAGKCNSFAATLRLAKLSAQQVVYLYNSVLIPKLEYRMQVTHLSETDCYIATRSICSLVKHKANFSRSLPNPIFYLSHALGLINLSSHLIQCHVNNLFLMANSSTPLIQHLFIYRLLLIQFRFLIPLSFLMVDDWSLWSSMTAFKCDYIACTIASMTSTPFCLQHARFSSTSLDLTLPGHTPLYLCMSLHVFKACLKVLRKCHLYYLSQLIAPSGFHLISWTAYRTAYIAQLADKRGRSLFHKWYLDIKANTTLPDSHDQLLDRYVFTLDGSDSSLFGKQLSVQPKKDTCMIVHWISDCLSSPGDVIRLRPCPGCDAHVLFSLANKYTAVPPRCTFKVSLLKSLILPTNCEHIRQTTTEVISPYSWADLSITMIPYYSRLDILPDFSSPFPVVECDSSVVFPLDNLSSLPSPVSLPSGSHYRYYTDGSLVNLGTPEVSMGWSWVQLIPDAGYLNSVATYTHGTIRNWPSFTRAEAAAIYAALSVSADDSIITIYTDSQAAIDGHDGNYWNKFADSLANSAHHSDMAPLLSAAAYTSSHNVRLVYDNVVCESNPRQLFKLHFQATFLKDLLSLKRFQFVHCLYNTDDYIVDWELTWFALNFFPTHDASFQTSHAAQHYTFKFKLFLDDLPLLEKLKITCSDLYIDILTCRSCCDRMEDLMHLILCSKRRSAMHQILPRGPMFEHKVAYKRTVYCQSFIAFSALLAFC
ncbi:hypothetical protein RclHR1_01830003 [Rhizophagus clarus]|uniref:Reverse transcriptase domain-containing protein n=1 Tax=Rhizophagus clarus TaxID=94130 RepID=A0A2Z6R0K5_9GLOM|nr:hypothetical protein RclHR1_01830003 [Rhizophagus clarus]